MRSVALVRLPLALARLHAATAPGDVIDLELPDGRKFTLAIRWVTRMEHGRYIIGCRFAEIADFG